MTAFARDSAPGRASSGHPCPGPRRCRLRRGRLLALADQQPVLRAIAIARFHAHQRVAATQTLAGKVEFEVAFAHAGARIADRRPEAAIPDVHVTTAVLTLR